MRSLLDIRGWVRLSLLSDASEMSLHEKLSEENHQLLRHLFYLLKTGLKYLFLEGFPVRVSFRLSSQDETEDD